jgi:acetyltransferase-like isoleucine patch superfamily enzyme
VLPERLLDVLDRARVRAGLDRRVDPRSGRVVGALTLREAVKYGWAEVGAGSYGPVRIQAGTNDGPVRIGAYCSFAAGTELAPGGAHRPDWVSTFPFRARFGLPGAFVDGHPRAGRGITIGSDVWMARGALVLDGVTVGDGAVIGAGAVVRRDVRPYAIVAGNPAAEVRRRFTDAQVEALLAIRWWDWPEAVVLERVDAICSPDVDAFIAAYG